LLFNWLKELERAAVRRSGAGGEVSGVVGSGPDVDCVLVAEFLWVAPAVLLKRMRWTRSGYL
jgi:hypothetical protein